MEAIPMRNITLTLDLIRLFIQINKYIYVYICLLKWIHQIEISEMDYDLFNKKIKNKK